MLNGSTALILGAGSSVEFGFLDGPGLAQRICKDLNLRYDFARLQAGDPMIDKVIRQDFANDAKAYAEAAHRVVDALPSFKSIDDLLHTYGDDEKMARMSKIAIARAISDYEGNSPLKEAWSIAEARERGLERLRKTWVHQFVQLLATGVRRGAEQQVFDDLFVVSFNYDRCFEAAVFHLIQPTFRLNEREAAEVMNGLKVYRPYGSLGKLALEGSDGVPYGPKSSKLVELAEGIRVYTEEQGQRPDLDEMRQRLDAVGQIVFLGFGFHRQNVDLLAVPNQRPRRIFATAFKLADPVREEVDRRIRSAFREPEPLAIAKREYDCATFMNDYAMALGL